MLAELLTRHSIFLPLTILIVVAYIHFSKAKAQVPIPKAFKSLGWFARANAVRKGQAPALQGLEEGYYKYSKHGQFFKLPDQMNEPVFIAPISMMKSLSALPDSVLGLCHADNLQSDYTFPHPAVVRNPIHGDVVRNTFMKKLSSLTLDIAGEAKAALDEYWGFDTENWQDIPVGADLVKVVARAANRVFVGLPLCAFPFNAPPPTPHKADLPGRNEDYLGNAGKNSQYVVRASSMIRLCPKLLRPIIGRIITMPNRYYMGKCFKCIIPVIKERIEVIKRNKVDPTLKLKEPNDFLQHQIRYSLEYPDPIEHKPELIAGRMSSMNFAAIHLSTMTTTSLLFDLYSSPSEKGYIEAIRQEITAVLSETNSVWTRYGLSKMVRLDSAIRENMRERGLLLKAFIRVVLPPSGITLENGLHLPQGTTVAVPAYSIHHDPDIYPNPMEYDAFRFVGREPDSSSKPEETDGEPRENGEGYKARSGHIPLVTSSAQFLAFGSGRHTCPGRFMAADVMKLITAYIILNYEIQPLPVRPPSRAIAFSMIPPMRATLKVRRRKGTF
ncbi:MAG: hypothetical protein M1839_002445 [Geoglossum umbratile]|nr:MAG: hypothetical protein M1839_002445 [Geoglossum umbratile]